MDSAKAIKAPAVETAANLHEEWTEVIRPKSRLLELRLKDVWRYRDLLFLMVRRDIVANYKQTILGPLWFFLQPLLTTLTFMVVFSKIAGISTDKIPPMVFYLAGITLWNYFADCLNKTATVFKDNASIFGKVYFPRLVMPLSIVVSNLIKMGIQLVLFLAIWAYYLAFEEANITPSWAIVLAPLLILILGGLGLGFGMIISALTTKYRDLIFLLTFGVQLLMYATPVIYSMSTIDGSSFKWLIQLNPMSSVIETFRYGFLGKGDFSWLALSYSAGFTIIVLIIGTIVFNKVEKSFMDTV